MMVKNGYATTRAIIRRIQFDHDRLRVLLADDRVIIIPLSSFPSIKKLTPSQKKKYQILDGVGIAFEDLDETFHISQFLGENNIVFPCK
jgi:hypothetical protein